MGANIGLGLGGLVMLVFGLPWSLVHEAGARLDVGRFGRGDFGLAFLGACMALNLTLHACRVAWRTRTA